MVYVAVACVALDGNPALGWQYTEMRYLFTGPNSLFTYA